MKKTLIATLAGMSMALMATYAHAADANAAKGSWIKLGTLTCHFDSSIGWIIGSSKGADCTYRDINGDKASYTAELSRLGVDVGYTGATTMVWAVLSPGQRDIDSLEGSYLGVSADATVAVGVNANALLGGFKKSIALQPISVGMQTGLNVAAAVGSLRLEAE